MKKALCLALCLLLCLLACAALADTEYEENHFRFAVNEEAGEVTILNLLENYAVVKVPDTLRGYPVTAVGSYAFYKSQRLQRVILPNTVTELGDYAFAYCSALETVQMNGVTRVGASAFENSGLHNITLPAGVTEVGVRAFAECQHLYSVKLPAALTQLPEEMFSGCKLLKKVTLSEGLTAIGDKAFCGCGMQEIALPNSVAELGVNPFIGCVDLTKIKVSANNAALKVEQNALITVEDSRLVSYAAGAKANAYTVPAGVKEIGVAAFSQSLNLKQVTVPASVEKVDDYAFWYCINLKSADVAEGVAVHPTAFAECFALAQ